MSRYDNKTLTTSDKCISCNRCISECIVPGANVNPSGVTNNKVYVDERKCVQCGKCIEHCMHGARTYRDDTLQFLEDLKNGKKYSLIVEPSFFQLYEERAFNILGYLKELGVEKIYSSAYGAEICLWAQVKYLKENEKAPVTKRAFISQTCPAFINYIVKYKSEILHSIIPVQSPMMCTAIYGRNYCNDSNDFVYLGTCVASKTEMDSPKTFGLVKLNVTIGNLSKALSDMNLSEYYAKPDVNTEGIGNYLSLGGSYKECVSYFFPRYKACVSYEGITENNITMLSLPYDENYEVQPPLFAEVYSCSHGCLRGPGTDKSVYNIGKMFSKYQKLHEYYSYLENYSSNPDGCFQWIDDYFSNLKVEDFHREFQQLYKQPPIIPSATYEDIFSVMLKDTPAKRQINCGMCGYKSCKEMATAIAYGYNKKENCIHYMNDEMVRRYYTDVQTGLLNRQGFIRDCERRFNERPQDKFVICSGDINRFRIIDDLYGTAAGDKVLVNIAETFKKAFPEEAVIARNGGGQFFLCFPHTPDNLNALYSILNFNCAELNIKFPVTMRFGIFISGAKNESIQNMMNYATLCMDSSVSAAQNTFTMFTSLFRGKMQMDIAITAQMQAAMENNEFQLYFQPQYNATSGKMVGAETLCRWIKPGGAIISPDIFIPIAEKNGFIRNLDKIIWEKAFASVRSWIDAGLEPVPVSVNISRVSLTSDSFVGEIDRLRKKYDVPLRMVHFEITESAYMDEKENMIRRIEQLKELGFMVAMDDFGSGYSTLNSLKDMPIDILKLDMGFLRHDSNMDKGGKIIANVIRMAQALQLITIAEGVETREQADFLKSVGCDVIQGYLYAKPMPEDKFRTMISNQQIDLAIEKKKETIKMDISSLYDLGSPENYMFENFTGPAGIFEYDSDKNEITILRMNSRLIKALGFEGTPFRIAKENMQETLRNSLSEDLQMIIKQIIYSEKEVSFAFVAKVHNSQQKITLKVNSWVISSNTTKYTIYALIDTVL
ncbi:MAG: EAL domain-containing protein [Treponema sp.]|nr:EAL domain-containing protein [Treponema sp.]